MNPLVVMALLQAATMGANYAGQRQQDKARSRVMAAERTRREGLQKKSEASAANTRDLLVGAAGKEGKRAEELAAEYKRPVAPSPAGSGAGLPSGTQSVVAPHSSQRVIQALEGENAKAGAYLGQQADARARLNAFGDVMSEVRPAVGRNAMDISQNTQSAQNWAQYVMPAQMARANEAGRGWGTLADAIQLASAIYAPTALAKPEAAVAGSFKEMAPDAFTRAVQGFGAAGTQNLALPGAAGAVGGSSLVAPSMNELAWWQDMVRRTGLGADAVSIPNY